VLADQRGRSSANPVFAASPSFSGQQPWTTTALAVAPLYAALQGPMDSVLRSGAGVSWSTLSRHLRRGYGDYVYGDEALNEVENVWPATRSSDTAPVVVKHIMSKVNSPIFSPIDVYELWGALLAHQHLPRAIPVLDVFIDKCRYPPGFVNWDTPALVFPRLLPLAKGPDKTPRTETQLDWRAFLAIAVAVYEHLVGLQRLRCCHLDIKPKNIVLATNDWARITPSDVYIIDHDMLMPFDIDLPDPAGTEGFWHGDFYDLKQGGCRYVTTGPRLDVCSAGYTLRSLLTRHSATPAVLADETLREMADEAMYRCGLDDHVPSTMSCMAQTLGALCRKHRLPFCPAS
jgi:hypothetical protein